MATCASVCAAEESGVPFATAHRVVDLADVRAEDEATAWSDAMTERSGRGW